MGFNTYTVPGRAYDSGARKKQNNFTAVQASDSTEPDYSGMTLREELEARFEDMEAQKQAQANRQKTQIASAERRRWENWLRYGEYAATAAEQGLSLGWADEMEGAARAVGYGFANPGIRVLRKFGADFQYPAEDWIDAVKRGYVEGRNRRRQIYKEGREQAPVLTGTMEYLGATASPVELVKVPPLASLHVKAAKRAANSQINGLIYGCGASEDLEEYPLNIAVNMVGNTLAHKGVNKFFGRGANGLWRQIPEETVSTGVNLVKDKIMDMYNQWK